MAITAKRNDWELGETSAEVFKTMTTKGARAIESISVHIFMPIDLSQERLKVLQKATEDCPVMRSIKSSIKININWNTTKRRY